jgi:hypothetical protein
MYLLIPKCIFTYRRDTSGEEKNYLIRPRAAVAGKRGGLKICGCERDTIGYQSELVGEEKRPLVYFSPVRSKKACFTPNRFRAQKFSNGGQ